jgi:hypothetical protein
VRAIASTAELRPVLMRTPFAFWDAAAGLAEILPRPPLTRNQVELMQIDTTASGNLPGFRELGISPRSLEDELEAMLKQSTMISPKAAAKPALFPGINGFGPGARQIERRECQRPALAQRRLAKQDRRAHASRASAR